MIKYIWKLIIQTGGIPTGGIPTGGIINDSYALINERLYLGPGIINDT